MCKVRTKQKSNPVVWLLALALILGGAFLFTSESVYADDNTVQLNGNSQFVVNGDLAFCVDNTLAGPHAGQLMTPTDITSENLSKTLYYGYKGPQQWSGFENSSNAYSVTSHLLHYYYHGEFAYSYHETQELKDFKAYVESHTPQPESMTFSKSVATVKWDMAKQKQISEDITIKGTEGKTMSFKVPEGAELVKEDGTKLTGTVTLKVGDKFHFEADAGAVKSGESFTWETPALTYGYRYKVTLYSSGQSNLQQLITGRIIEDTSIPSTLKVQFLDNDTKVDITKVDITNDEEIEGANMQVIDSTNNQVVDEWVSKTEAHVIKGLIKNRKYYLKETKAPKTYEVNTETIEFVPGQDEKVTMKDAPIEIKGQIDKKQTKFNVKNGTFEYSLDYRSNSSTWADEYNMVDTLDCVTSGYAKVDKIKTPVAYGDYDGTMNVWYKTNKSSKFGTKAADGDSQANASAKNPYNPWNPNNERVYDYSGWKLWKANVSTLKSETLNVSDLGLEDGEYVTAVAFEHGRVEAGFTTRKDGWDDKNLKSVNDTVDKISTTNTGTFQVNDPSTGEGNDPSTGDENNPSTGEGNDPSTGDEDGPSTGIDDPSVDKPVSKVASISEEYTYEPAVLYMEVLDKSAAKSGKQFWNTASISVYRNLGGSPLLEAKDIDKVVQRNSIVRPNSTNNNLGNGFIATSIGYGPRTGDDITSLILGAVIMLMAAGGIVLIIRKRHLS